MQVRPNNIQQPKSEYSSQCAAAVNTVWLYGDLQLWLLFPNSPSWKTLCELEFKSSAACKMFMLEENLDFAALGEPCYIAKTVGVAGVQHALFPGSNFIFLNKGQLQLEPWCDFS